MTSVQERAGVSTAAGDRPPSRASLYLRDARRRIVQNWDLYILIFLPFVYFTIFHYGPMYGVQIAFRDFTVGRTILESPWVGLKHFNRFFNSFLFWRILRNTAVLAVYELAAGFPIPIVLAISLHYATRRRFKKTVQMITYAPHFISTVVLVGIIMQVLHLRIGLVNGILGLLGAEPINFLGRPELFAHIHVWSNVWRGMGWGQSCISRRSQALTPSSTKRQSSTEPRRCSASTTSTYPAFSLLR